jgi:hypothetical protein
MFNVSIANNYIYPLYLDGGNMPAPPPKNKSNFKDWGSHILTVPGMGEINFIDMGDYKIDKYIHKDFPWTHYTWGGMIRYQGLEAYFRYEGQGEVKVVVDRFGGVNLSFKENGGMMVKMDDLRVVPNP